MFCSSCGAQVADNVASCPGCGKATGQSAGGGTAAGPAPSAGAGGLADNMAGALAYVTIIPAILFLVMEPYNRNRFIRFHAFQCLFTAVAFMALGIVLNFIPVLGWIVALFMPLIGLVLWVLLVVMAYQGKKFKLPVIGDMAEKQADAVA